MEALPHVLMAIDPATTLGWASYEDLGRDRYPRVQCGTFTAKGEPEARLFGDCAVQMRELLDRVRPRRVAIEMRLPSFARGSEEDDPRALTHGRPVRKQIRNEANVKRQDGIRGIILAQLGMRRPSMGLPNGIPYEEVNSQTWRRSFFGEGHRPPPTIAPEKRRNWWKAEARLKAEMLGVRWGFSVPNADAAEAVGMVIWLAAREGTLAARDALKRVA